VRQLDLTLPGAAENLALDEALLEEAESAGPATETLRFWEPRRPIVVVGRSSSIDREVHLETCRALEIPVLRRVSGGAAVLTGPGCLMYAVVLNLRRRPGLRSVGLAHRFVLGRLAAALEPLVPGVHCQGTSDLAIDRRKFSGNSIRLKRDCLLYHGTLLYDFPLGLIGRCLAMPPRQPEYRNGRPHEAFLTNLPLRAAAIRRALIAAWGADRPRPDWPGELTARLVAEKYGRPPWTEQR
jgi:lipoate-protein ligase A